MFWIIPFTFCSPHISPLIPAGKMPRHLSTNVGCVLGFAAATFLAASQIQGQSQMSGFTLGTVSTNQPPSFTGTRGWGFSHDGGNAYIAITALGVFDSGGDGLVNSHQIGLWSPD